MTASTFGGRSSEGVGGADDGADLACLVHSCSWSSVGVLVLLSASSNARAHAVALSALRASRASAASRTVSRSRRSGVRTPRRLLRRRSLDRRRDASAGPLATGRLSRSGRPIEITGLSELGLSRRGDLGQLPRLTTRNRGLERETGEVGFAEMFCPYGSPPASSRNFWSRAARAGAVRADQSSVLAHDWWAPLVAASELALRRRHHGSSCRISGCLHPGSSVP